MLIRRCTTASVGGVYPPSQVRPLFPHPSLPASPYPPYPPYPCTLSPTPHDEKKRKMDKNDKNVVLVLLVTTMAKRGPGRETGARGTGRWEGGSGCGKGMRGEQDDGVPCTRRERTRIDFSLIQTEFDAWGILRRGHNAQVGACGGT